MIKKILPCVMAFMFVLCLPSVALAVGGEPKVNWSEDGNICRIWITRNNTPDYPCENEFDAASWMLGVNPARLTDEQKAKLSNESTGGQFWVFAQAIEGSTASDFDLGLYPGLPAFVTIYGNYYYAVECSKDLFYAAQNDLHVIISGGSLGGGSAGGGDFDGYTLYKNPSSITFYPQAATSPNVCYYTYSGTRYYLYPELMTGGLPSGASAAPATLTLEASQSDKAVLDGYVQSGYDVIYVLQFNSSGYFNSFLIVAKPEAYEIATHERGWPVISFKSNYATGSVKTRGGTTTWFGVTLTSSNSCLVTFGNTTALLNCDGLKGSRIGMINGYTNNSAFGSGGGGGGGGGGGTWPEPDPTPQPDPPTPPDPVGPVSPEPDPPTPPDLPDPYMPIVEPEPTGTDPIDYTPWLRAILRELQNFHRDNIAVLNSINSQIVSSSNAIIADLNYMIDYMLGQLKDEFAATRSYIRACLEWLASQMDFSFTADGYDDSSVVSYLQQILYELQKAPDVTTNPFDFFGWLNGLLGNLLSGLLGAVLGSLASFTEPLEALTGKFPFSLPWDIAAILALFVAPAQVPIFDIPFAGYGSVHVDLSGFDVVAQVVRALMLVLFAYGLTQRTKDMLDLIDKIVG